jgi:hypothetical protein
MPHVPDNCTSSENFCGNVCVPANHAGQLYMSAKKRHNEVFVYFRLNYFCLGLTSYKLCAGILIFSFMGSNILGPVVRR